MNLDLIRADTPGCTQSLFLNSAGSSLMPKRVVERVTDYLKEEEAEGGYQVAARFAAEIEEFYTETARLLQGAARNIAFATSATQAYFQVLSSIPITIGDFLLTSTNDNASNQIAFLSLQRRRGVKILKAENLPTGELDLDSVEGLLQQHQPKVVAITHVPTNSGLIQPAAEIGQLCRKFDAWYLLDACQSVGQLNVNVQEIGCDFLSATGRKFLRGPRGTGFLYVSDKALQAGLAPELLDMQGADWIAEDAYQLREDARRFELWENSYANLLGLKTAIAYANQIGITEIETYNQMLVGYLRKKMAVISGLKLLDRGREQCSIVTFQLAGIGLAKTEQALQAANVRYSVSRKTNALLDFTEKGVEWAIRFSPHYFNSHAKIDQVVEVLERVKP